VNGLPCLYAGHSIYACWEEMGRPDLSKFHVSRIESSPVVPQLLMQWVCQEEGLDGVMYFSNRVSSSIEPDWSMSLNYAIPARTNQPNGYCKALLKKMRITEPITWERMLISSPDIVAQPISESDKMLWLSGGSGTFVHEHIPGVRVPYWGTVFGRMEIQLLKMQAVSLRF
jgi:hypothetical protein